MTADETFVRPLGGLEIFCRERTFLDMFRSHSVSIEFEESIPTELLFAVFRELVLEHPTMACHVATENDDGSAVLSLIKKFYFRDLVKFESAKTLDEALSAKIVEEYKFDVTDATKPLVQFLILEGGKELVCVAEHTIFDGVTSGLFWQLFQKKLQEIDQRGRTLPPVDYDTAVVFDFFADRETVSAKFMPKAEDLYPMVPSTYSVWAKWLKGYLPKFLQNYIYTFDSYGDDTKGYKKWKPQPFTSARPKTGHRFVHFSPDEVKHVLKACREHKTAITAYINYCLTFTAINGNHAVGFNREEEYVRCGYVVGSRRHLIKEQLEKYDTAFGNHYIAGYGHNLNYDDLKDFSWDKVIEMNKEMNRKTGDARHIQCLAPICKKTENVVELRTMLRRVIFNDKLELFKISNLGLVSFTEDSKWIVKDMKFSQDPSHIAAHFITSVISTKLGGMNVCISYIDAGTLSNVEGMCKEFKNTILSHT